MRTLLSSDVKSRVGEVAEDVVERAEDIAERAGELYERRDEARERATSLWREARLLLWRGLRAMFGLLLVLPRAFVYALEAMHPVAVRAVGRGEKMADRGADLASTLAERTKQAADALPPARSTRRRRRMKSVVVVGTAFGAGFCAGWYLSRRAEAQLEGEEPAGEDLPSDEEEQAFSPNGQWSDPATAGAEPGRRFDDAT